MKNNFCEELKMVVFIQNRNKNKYAHLSSPQTHTQFICFCISSKHVTNLYLGQNRPTHGLSNRAGHGDKHGDKPVEPKLRRLTQRMPESRNLRPAWAI